VRDNGQGPRIADVKIAGPVGSMGQRVLQPIVTQQVSNVLTALEKQVAAAAGGGAEAGVHPGSPEAYSTEPDAPAPDAPPADSDFRAARLDAFRAALDAGGLTGVHFRMVGDTMVLTGTVPNATDKAMVQMLALNVAGVVSLKDQIRVQDSSAGP